MWLRRQVAVIAIVVAVMSDTSACGVNDTLGQAENTIQSAIDQLALVPGNVNAVLSDLIQKLNTATNQTIKNAAVAAKDLLTQAGGLVTAVSQCAYDSVGVHVRDALIYIKAHVLQGHDAPPPTPWVCLTSPADIQVLQSSANGPYQLTSAANYQIFGFNFRESSLPRVDYARASGTVAAAAVVAPGLHTPYEIDINLQTVDFSAARPGDYFALDWPSGGTGSNRISIILTPYKEPPQPRHRTEQFTVSVHADPGVLHGECKKIQADPLSNFTVGSSPTANWKIDRSQGDPGHPGVREVVKSDNKQSRDSLRGYNYEAKGDQEVQVTGTICGAGGWGPGAIFNRQYLIYEIAPPA